MDESAALNVVAVRAIETADGSRSFWNDDERAWASRAAAEIVGADAASEAFVVRRAQLVIEKLGMRHPALPRALRAMTWRRWVGTAIVCIAFVVGFFVDQVGSGQRINILAPPVLALLIWNLAIYLAMIVRYIARFGEPSAAGPLRIAVARVAGAFSRPRGGGALRDAIVAFFDDWSRRAAGLYAMRAARILHFAAAALAAGIIAGLYVRGIAFEYHANWESTFLDASTVRSIVAVAYAPGTWLTGIAIPSVESIAAIRSPAGENAARWLHLIAATIIVVVIVPRVLLGVVALATESARARRLLGDLDEPYFQRLLRRYRGRPARVRVIPYSYTPTPATIAAIETVIERTLGTVATTIAQPVAYGAETMSIGDAAGTTLVALFNASATPEREVHGAFLSALAREKPRAEAVIALIDEASWAAHWQSAPTRVADRRAAWRALANDVNVPIVFVDLSAPAATDENALDDALAARAQ